ncbi:MAG TPA: helix-turn-helix domain-containing protein [Acidimicrobiia bacterium]|nr:helix-turn-helix domain-containing protein [Acidimicrobiia bacterium]
MAAPIDALRNPTRTAIVRFLAHTPDSTASDIARGLGVDESTVRRQLPDLVASGLLVERIVRTGRRGRPSARYRATPAADALLAGGPLEDVACMLAEVIQTGDAPVAIGRRHARPRVDHDVEPMRALVDELALHGFAPEVVQRNGRSEVVLQECPLARVAEQAPATVCALHLGLIEATAEAVGAPAIAGLHPKPPRMAGCRVVFDQ